MISKVDSKYLIEGSNFFYFRKGQQVFLGTCHAIPPVMVHDLKGTPWVMMTPGLKSLINGKLKTALDDYLRGAAV